MTEADRQYTNSPLPKDPFRMPPSSLDNTTKVDEARIGRAPQSAQGFYEAFAMIGEGVQNGYLSIDVADRAVRRLFDDALQVGRRQGKQEATAIEPKGDFLMTMQNGKRTYLTNIQSPAMVTALRDVLLEHANAVALNEPFHSAHEGHSVIEEEYIEFRDEVFSNPRKFPGRDKRMRAEAVQLTAMGLRFLTDVCDHA